MRQRMSFILGRVWLTCGSGGEPRGSSSRPGSRSGEPTENALSQADVYRMIRRRALAAPQRYATALCFLASLVYRPRHQCLGVRCMQLTHASLRTSRHISVPAFAWAA